MFAAEIYMHRFLLSNPVRTLNPEEADWFYTPVYTTCDLTPNGLPLPFKSPRMMRSAIQLISSNWPYWNRTEGADHFFIVPHDFGACFHYLEEKAIDRGILPLLQRATLVQTFGQRNHVCLKDGSVIIPPYAPPQKMQAHLIPPTTPRSIFVYFRGLFYDVGNDPEGGYYARGARASVWENFKNNPLFDISTEHPTTYYEDMQRAVFCLCPLGWAPWSPRLVEAVVFGCIPVIIADDIVLPFADAIPWEEIGVFVDEKDVPKLDTILTSIPIEEILRKQRLLANPSMKQAMLFPQPAQSRDAFHQILNGLARKLPHGPAVNLRPGEKVLNWTAGPVGDLKPCGQNPLTGPLLVYSLSYIHTHHAYPIHPHSAATKNRTEYKSITLSSFPHFHRRSSPRPRLLRCPSGEGDIMSSSLLCFSATFLDEDDDNHYYHDIYVVDVSSRCKRRRHTDIPSLTPTLRVSGQYFGDTSCVTSSGVFLFNSNLNLHLSRMKLKVMSKESADPLCVRRINISKYHSTTTTTSRVLPMKADHTMVEHVCPLISRKRYLQVLPTPNGKIIAFSTRISRPEPSTTTTSSSVPDAPPIVDFELYHPDMDRWEALPSIPRGLEIQPGSSHLSGSGYTCSSRIVTYWFMGGTPIFAVMCDGGFIFHLDLTASPHPSWTYKPWPLNVRSNLSFGDGEYIYVTDDWCLTPRGARHLTGPLPSVPRWRLSNRELLSSNREGKKTSIGVRDVGSEGLPTCFYIVESTFLDNTMKGCKLSVCEYTCNVRPYLKKLCKMEAKQKAVRAKIEKRYEVERKVREAHKGAMKFSEESHKLMQLHAMEASYAWVKQVPQLDCNVSSSFEFLLVTPPSFNSWILGNACFI
ncbi:Probable beta-1-4-xylosyltransferase IRX10L [Striga hermonthica]|uniref:Probable beta-1-4-xylosyltransferase IRX10L n=1 Tax=Striga hermonthica TaxID=68872 RepID=A0A9N7R4H1_STRHE|nr:Probable beta-1-4-xylosyltransferase IRX10L [Striga hermonthica]